MSNQSFTNKILDPEERSDAMQDLSNYGRQNRRPLIVGAILGLLLGLFIGWVVWPTQWTNVWPPDLAEPAKADYIAAVADAFVASRSDEAADLAYQRLSSFGDEMEAELAKAALYFEQAESSDSAVRISNIQELAASVRPVPAPEVIVEVSEGESRTGEEVEELVDQVVPVEPTDSSNWLQLVLWLLAAFVLIAGGIWVLRAVMRPPLTQSASDDDDDDDEIDEFEDEDLDSHSNDRSVDGDTSSADDDHDNDTDFAAATAIATGAIIGQMVTDEEEQNLADVADSYAPPPAASTVSVATTDGDIDTDSDNPSISVRAGTAGAAPDSTYLEEQESYGFGPETDLPAGGGGTTVVIDTDPEMEAVESGADAGETSPPEDDTSEDVVDNTTDVVFLTPGREVNRFKAVYYPMLDEYEEAFRIEDTIDGEYIGDCGMGVNMKYGFVQNNPEQVASLDVWLIDLVKDDDMSFHTQTLVGKYDVDQLSDTDTDDGEPKKPVDNQIPVTLMSPKTGDRFQIVGENLQVDCEVVSVSYMESGAATGAFKGLEVNLIVSHTL